jgi:hypothetical protein
MSEEKKSAGADLIKDMTTISEGSAQRQTASHKKYDF